jgi:hypothetical protein
MRYIALFFPAIISVGIKNRRDNEKTWTLFDFIREYAISVIGNVLLAQSVVVYVLRLGNVNIEAFDSFPFFTKYVFISLAFSVILPYIREIIKMNFSVSFEVDKKQ